MGYTNYSDDVYQARQASLRASGKTAFNYTDQVVQSLPPGTKKVHASLDPYGVKFRESRDSDAHPKSRAIAVLFDETGSMGHIPRVLQTKLPTLMALLLRKGYVADPQVLFGAVGDAGFDEAPIQIGQFESGVEMDQTLENLYLEGKGGGNMHESYELSMYFMARHTQMDCFEKRGEPGYLFIIGDELPYDVLPKEYIQRLIGDTVETDIPISQILSELNEKFEVFFIHVPSNAYGRDAQIVNAWKTLLPERVIELADANLVCETIASAIGMMEGTATDIATDLNSVGAGQAAPVVTKALANIPTRSGSALAVSDAGRGVKNL